MKQLRCDCNRWILSVDRENGFIQTKCNKCHAFLRVSIGDLLAFVAGDIENIKLQILED